MSEQIPANEPAIDRPPVTADVAPPGVDAEGAPQTRIGRFKLPTETLVAYMNIPAFIVTLGGMLAWRGAVLWKMQGRTVTIELPVYRSIGEGFVAPVAGIALAALAIAALIFFTLKRNRARRRHGLTPS